LGPYEILASIGAGGMGEVYRARDGKLKREVALNILPAAFACDPDHMTRFQREAEVLASLNPNIATIYGFEDNALAMEMVEGETHEGPLSLERRFGWHIRWPKHSSTPTSAASFIATRNPRMSRSPPMALSRSSTITGCQDRQHRARSKSRSIPRGLHGVSPVRSITKG
jgi:serine/threonine protein kinase